MEGGGAATLRRPHLSGAPRALRWGLSLLTAAALATLLWVVVAAPYQVFAVRTGSMTPTIPPRSAVVVHEGVYHVGQVVSYRKDGGVITHRLIKLSPDGTFKTKGDANRTADPWTLPTSALIGGVVAAPPVLGYWLVYLKEPAGAASLVFGVLCLWLLWSAAGRQEGSAYDRAHGARP